MKKPVLVVDDDSALCNNVKIILEKAGFIVETAKNGEECVKKIENGFQGLIFMDILMPGMNGWDTIQALVDRGLSEGNIICMLTGQEKPDDRMDSLKEYILDYILKPFNPKKLVSVVERYLSLLDS